MGFHAVTFGIVVSKHYENPDEILQLIAKEIKEIEPGRKYNITLFDDIVPKFPVTMTDKGLTFIIDIEDVSDLRFVYAKNKNIIVGVHYCCHYMIHVGPVGDECDSLEKTIPDETIMQLIQWKEELIKSGRLDDDISLSLIGNCCS